MIIIQNLNDAAFERMTRRRVLFESAASNGTAQETVLLPREVITKLANGEKIKGSLHAAIDGVYFTPYNIDSPNAKRAAAWAMPISVSERSGEREYKNHVSAMSNACMVICIIHLREFRLTSSHHRCKVSDKRVPVER